MMLFSVEFLMSCLSIQISGYCQFLFKRGPFVHYVTTVRSRLEVALANHPEKTSLFPGRLSPLLETPQASSVVPERGGARNIDCIILHHN